MKESFERTEPEYHEFADGRFTFWEVIDNGRAIVFRAREDTTPARRAIEKGIPKGNPIIPAEAEHIQQWLDGHPNQQIR